MKCPQCKQEVFVLNQTKDELSDLRYRHNGFQEICINCLNENNSKVNFFEFIKITITPKIELEAEKLAKLKIEESNRENLKSRFQTDIFNNHKNGFIGELGFKLWLDSKNIKYIQKTYSQQWKSPDISDFEINGELIEIKTLVGTTVPCHHFYVNVNEKQMRARICDTFFFNHYNRITKTLWIVGFISKSDFMKKSILKKKGTVSEKIVIYDNVYNMRIEQLNPPLEFFNAIKTN